MKFYLETHMVSDDETRVNVIHQTNENEFTELGHLSMTLDLVDGKLVCIITSHRSDVLPVIEFQYGKVSEVHRHKPSAEWNPNNIPPQQNEA